MYLYLSIKPDSDIQISVPNIILEDAHHRCALLAKTLGGIDELERPGQDIAALDAWEIHQNEMQPHELVVEQKLYPMRWPTNDATSMKPRPPFLATAPPSSFIPRSSAEAAANHRKPRMERSLTKDLAWSDRRGESRNSLRNCAQLAGEG